MREGGEEGPEAQLGGFDAGEEARVAAVPEKVEAQRDDHEARADADLAFPFDQRDHHGEG